MSRNPPEPGVRPEGSVQARPDESRPISSQPDHEPREAEWDSVAAWFGKYTRSGDWAVPHEIRAVACFGEVELDFREAELPSGRTVDVDALSLFGQLRLIVPAGAEVDLDGARAVFGQVSQVSRSRAGQRAGRRGGRRGDGDELDPDEEPLLLRVAGTALFGKVVVEHR